MQHVRLTLDADGREADVHPVYDVLANAPFVDRATAVQWSYTGDELGMMHYVEGDRDAFAARVEAIPAVPAYELAAAGDGAFYAYVRGETTDGIRETFDVLTRYPLVVVPPIRYTEAGTVACSLFGTARHVQATIDGIPDPFSVTVREVTGMAAMPGVVGPLLSDRQRAAVEAARSLGYYEVPREAGHEAVADVIDCAPSTAAEHLRKAEATLMESILGD